MHRTHVQREAAVRGFPCPVCHRRPGHRCTNLSNRAVTPHRLRVELALAAAERAGPCPSRSPDLRHLCALPALRSWHHHGHHAFPRPTTSVAWSAQPVAQQAGAE